MPVTNTFAAPPLAAANAVAILATEQLEDATPQPPVPPSAVIDETMEFPPLPPRPDELVPAEPPAPTVTSSVVLIVAVPVLTWPPPPPPAPVLPHE